MRASNPTFYHRKPYKFLKIDCLQKIMYPEAWCCGSGTYSGSRIRFFHSGFRIQCWQDKIKDFKYFYPKIDTIFSKKRSRMFILLPGSCLWFFSIPDPESRGQKAIGSRLRNTGHDYRKNSRLASIYHKKATNLFFFIFCLFSGRSFLVAGPAQPNSFLLWNVSG